VIIDTSAIVAIIRQEPDAEYFAAALESSPVNRISAGTWLEVAIVIDRARDPVVSRQLDALLEAAGIVVEPVTASQARIARDAYRDFGKGTGHPAGLNLGDCFAYALARELNEPLLFKGDDFSHTDIPLVGSPAERRRLGEGRAAYGASATA
jgi:ribonuclease VapC